MAPYSYDRLDNAGRRSPATLTPGLTDLAIGQRNCGIFRLDDFRPDDHLTVHLDDPRARSRFGPLVLTYRLSPCPEANAGCWPRCTSD